MKSWFQRWVVSVGIAEFIGIGVATVAFIACNKLIGEPVAWWQKSTVLAAIIVAGGIEGWLVGYFQAKRLRELIPELDSRAWIRRTVALAASTWFLGMLPSTIFFADAAADNAPTPDFPLWLTILSAMLMGLLFGAVFGWVQMPVLKLQVGRPARSWVLANALAWAAGLWWVFFFAALPDGTEPLLFIVAGGVLSGLLMGLTVGFVTGLFLMKMLKKNK